MSPFETNINDVMADDDKTTTNCNICTDDKALVNMFTNHECSHSFCKDCISNHIAAKLEDNIANVKCPQPGCEAVLHPDVCHSFVPKNVLDRWGYVLCEAFILGNHRLIYCPFMDCSVALIDDGDEATKEAECPGCNRMFCAKCNVVWHGGVECEEFQKLCLEEKERDDHLLAIKLAEQENWKRCPHCRTYVEMIEGCPYIICRCRTKFCYSCGAKWGGSHACPESAEARKYRK